MTETHSVHREMGLGHAELYRLLPAALGNRRWSREGDRILIEGPPGPIEIRVDPEKSRRIGSLHLPVTLLKFSFQNFTNPEIREFMRRFDLSFRRGGG